jgi:hypothetical protein
MANTCQNGPAVAQLLLKQSQELHELTQRGPWNNKAYPFERELIKALRAQQEAAAATIGSYLIDDSYEAAKEVRDWAADNPELARKHKVV